MKQGERGLFGELLGRLFQELWDVTKAMGSKEMGQKGSRAPDFPPHCKKP